jgi:hypothetical protein
VTSILSVVCFRAPPIPQAASESKASAVACLTPKGKFANNASLIPEAT